MTENQRDTWQEFQNNTIVYKEHIVPFKGYSADVINDLVTYVTSIDMLFIDGDHSYEGVKADWENYKQFLKAGSMIVFHDWGWAEGVKRVITEEVKPLVDSYDSLPNMWWGTINLTVPAT